MQTAYANTTVPNEAGVDTARIQRAIDDESQSGTATNPGLVQLSASGDCSNQYTIDGTIDMRDDVVVRSTSDTGGRFCLTRSTLPGPNTGNAEFPYFDNSGRAIHNFTLQDANIDGRGPGDVPLTDQAAFVDFGLLSAPDRRIDPDRPSTFTQDITVNHVTFDHMYGVCTYTIMTQGIVWNDVDCVNPTKGGMIFANGSRNGDITNSRVTQAGDDGFAITSSQSQASDTTEALTYNFVLDNVFSSQETDDRGGASFSLRGPQLVTIRNSQINPGAGAGSLWVTNSPDANDTFPSKNITINGNDINGCGADCPKGPSNGIHISGATDPVNVDILSNRITYNSAKCGIQVGGTTSSAGITQAGNIFQPDNPETNYCK